MFVSVSHPLLDEPSQLPNPAAHAPSVQVPALHVSEAFGRSQTALHPPQLVSVLMSRSQPSLALPLQSP